MNKITVTCLVLLAIISLSTCSDSFQPSDDKSYRFDQDTKEINAFLNTKNIFKTLVKLLFGTNEESTATSRQVLNVLVKVLDMIKNSFNQKARSATRGFRGAVDDATVAGVNMLQGYVKSVLTNDDQCTQKYLCESSKQALQDGRELGFVITQLGGYAASYFLENQKSTPFNRSFEAIKKGRSKEDCGKLYPNCNETK